MPSHDPYSTDGDDVGVLLPFYVCVDVSFSMAGEPLNAAQELFPELVDALSSDPILSDLARVSLVEFSDSCDVLIPLGDPRDIVSFPGLRAQSGTNYGELFKRLRQNIYSDVNALKQDGYRVYRPMVFMITDGAPTDTDWHFDFKLLTEYDRRTGEGNRLYPTVVPFGVGNADLDVLRECTHPPRRSRFYVARDGVTAAQAIAEMTKLILSSVVASTASVAHGDGLVLIQPPPESGIRTDDTGSDDWI